MNEAVQDFLHPALSQSTQAFIRTAYGVLVVATLLQALPEARRFFVSDRWQGYAKSSPAIDLAQNPYVMPLLLATWMAAAIGLVFGWATPWPALVNVVLCRYFFIHMRWKGVLRGMGAPGFMSYWTGLVVFLLEYTTRFAPGERDLALLVAQVDLAFIILSAGIYKATAGYLRNHGMELGLCNPMWGYWWRRYVRLRPGHWVYWTMNQFAWATEVVAAILMLLPATRELGGVVLALSFLFILTQIRLGFLCEMVIVCAFLFVTPDGVIDRSIAAVVGSPQAIATSSGAAVSLVNTALAWALWVYLILLPLAHGGLYYNFYRRQGLPPPLQQWLERYTNLFGIIIWRVFSVDLVNFFIQLHAEPRIGGERRLIGRLGSWPRFNHVGEMICLTSLFTTLKYYPSNDRLFRERVLRYARTVSRAASEILVFEYVSVVKQKTCFDWVPAVEYHVDPDAETVTERLIDPSFSARAAHSASPVHEGAVPGSYAPTNR